MKKHIFPQLLPPLLIAVILTLLCLLIGCADENNPGVTPTPSQSVTPTLIPTDVEPTEEARLVPDIPETYDFNGETLSFLYWNQAEWDGTVRHCRDIVCEEYDGDRVSTAVYNRNAVIEQNYKVKIEVDIQQYTNIFSKTQTMIASGDETYQVVVPRLYEAGKMVSNGCFLNLYDVPHVDLTKPWWDRDSVSQLSCNGILYLTSCSMLVNDKDATAAIVFSKDAAKDKSLGVMYDYVANNQWTYETVATVAELANEDLDGDGTMELDDFWGFLGKYDVMTSFFHGSGGLFVGKNERTDEFYFAFGENDTDIEASVAILDFIRSSEWFFNQHLTNVSDTDYPTIFTSGHGLFFWIRLDAVTAMRGSEVEFGILPIPKYTPEQDSYHHTVSQHTTGLLSVPKSVCGDKLEMTGMVLEALNAESHYTLQPAYVEDSLKTRYSRDAESKEMLTIILGSRVFDPGCIFSFNKFANDYQNLAGDATSGIASFYAANRDAAEEAVDRFNQDMESY